MAGANGRLKDGTTGLGPTAEVGASVRDETGALELTHVTRAEVVTMEVEVAVDGDGCSLVELAGGVGAGMRRSTSACHSGCAWDRGCGRPRAVRCRQGRQ